MTDDLNIAIENLYSTFAIYPFKSTIEGCPCCVSDADKEKIHSKHLRALDGDDLSKYAFKAMTTWGNTDDFKHYLPRIFELLATTDFVVDTFVVLGKLAYGQWQIWTEKEQVAIEHFLFAWWADLIRTKPYFDKEAFIEINKLTQNTDKLLDLWIINFSDRSFANYVELVYMYYYDLSGKQKDFKGLEKTSMNKLLNWIKFNSPKLEEGFFHFESIDKELADKISTSIYTYKRIELI